MRILAIETCFDACSVALYDAANDRVLAECSQPMDRGHAEALFGLIAQTMAEAEADLASVDTFAVSVGPGSFTGVRIGIAAARGFALAGGRPVVGVSTLELMARSAGQSGPVAAVHDALRGQVYLAVHHDDLALRPAAILNITEAAGAIDSTLQDPESPIVLTGSGAALVAGALRAMGRVPQLVTIPKRLSPALLARLAAKRDPAAGRASPLYLRAPDAKLPGGIDPAIAL